jgi:cation:H+ antiporter
VQRLLFFLAFAVCAPATTLYLAGGHAAPPIEAVLFGAAILGAAFVLSWAAEVAQVDIPKSLAVGILALICVLPEYAVDMYFAWHAAEDPQYTHYAAANMTGSNRLLVGLGWPAVFIIYALKYRKRSLKLDRSHRTDILFLGLATAWSFLLPLKRSLSLLDTVVFVSLFCLYAWRLTKGESEEPDLVGPARELGKLPTHPRRFAFVSMFLISGAVILMSAERFAEALIHTGKQAGIDEFLLVQWVAPLASEAPEFIVALVWSFRGEVAAGLGALISSKVNQWTLLIGTLPIAYSLNLGHPGALILDTRQQHELFLTASQSLFAVAVLLNLRLSWYGAVLLFGLFTAQLLFEQIRVEVSIVYLVLAFVVLIRDWAHVRGRGFGAGKSSG